MTNKENNFAKDINVPRKEQIIIDGVDVSECAYFDYENEGTRECDVYGNECEANNCYYKQLARKTQECEELRVAYNKAQDIIGRVNGANELKSYSLQESIKECDRYRKALEEIEKICLEDTYTFADGKQIRYDTLDDILNIINKIKGEQND